MKGRELQVGHGDGHGYRRRDSMRIDGMKEGTGTLQGQVGDSVEVNNCELVMRRCHTIVKMPT